jgi:hypothetical protein
VPAPARSSASASATPKAVSSIASALYAATLALGSFADAQSARGTIPN